MGLVAGGVLIAVGAALCVALVGGMLGALSAPATCDDARATQRSIALGPPGSGARVGATEYGGPGDPSSGTVGASGIDLLTHPDSYAELGGTTFQTATRLGGLPYMAPLRITWGARAAIAYKRDFGLGGGPIGGLPRVIDLWWELAGALGIPYEHGLWSGPVTIARPPATGSGNLLSGTPPAVAATPALSAAAGCEPPVGVLPVTAGPRATLLGGGRAAAPADAPAVVKGIIAAGDQIAGKPYVFGGSHGLPLDQVGAAYDCSSSVAHLLYGGGLLPVDWDGDSSSFRSFGRPGRGRWVTIYTSSDHVFMYVAGLRWDTHDAAGPDDGIAGIGWHPLIREAAGFVIRHPVGW